MDVSTNFSVSFIHIPTYCSVLRVCNRSSSAEFRLARESDYPVCVDFRPNSEQPYPSQEQDTASLHMIIWVPTFLSRIQSQLVKNSQTKILNVLNKLEILELSIDNTKRKLHNDHRAHPLKE